MYAKKIKIMLYNCEYKKKDGNNEMKQLSARGFVRLWEIDPETDLLYPLWPSNPHKNINNEIARDVVVFGLMHWMGKRRKRPETYEWALSVVKDMRYNQKGLL